MKNNSLENIFIENITKHQGIIHKVCNIYCTNHENKTDLMQEITLQLWKSYPGFQGKSKFSTWMYRIALNTAISNVRKTNKMPLMEALFESQIEIPEKENLSEDDEDVNRLYKIIGKLKVVDKGIILLYLEDKSYKEIAEIIGISEKNVAVKMHRLKKKLEQLILSERAS